MSHIGKKIRLLRHEQGWSQEEVAGQLGISIPAYSKIETGITDINFSRLKELAAVFGMTEIDMLAEGDHHQTETSSSLKMLYAQLASRQSELLDLQRQIIRLYEELKK